MPDHRLGYLLVLVAACCWGLIGPLSRFVLESGTQPLELAFWRALFGGILFCGHAFCKNSLRVHSRKDALALALFGIFSLGLMFTVYQEAVRQTGAALASVLLYTAPAWVAIASRLCFGEPITRAKGLAIALSLAGVGCISFSGGGLSSITWWGVMCGLLSGFLYSTHFVVAKIYLTRYTPMSLYGIGLFFAAVGLCPAASLAGKTAFDWVILGTLGCICTYAAYWAYSEGIKRLSPVRVAVIATTEPGFATFFAWMWWKEQLTPLGWAGAALILTAVLAMTARGRAQEESLS